MRRYQSCMERVRPMAARVLPTAVWTCALVLLAATLAVTLPTAAALATLEHPSALRLLARERGFLVAGFCRSGADATACNALQQALAGAEPRFAGTPLRFAMLPPSPSDRHWRGMFQGAHIGAWFVCHDGARLHGRRLPIANPTDGLSANGTSGGSSGGTVDALAAAAVAAADSIGVDCLRKLLRTALSPAGAEAAIAASAGLEHAPAPTPTSAASAASLAAAPPPVGLAKATGPTADRANASQAGVDGSAECAWWTPSAPITPAVTSVRQDYSAQSAQHEQLSQQEQEQEQKQQEQEQEQQQEQQEQVPRARKAKQQAAADSANASNEPAMVPVVIAGVLSFVVVLAAANPDQVAEWRDGLVSQASTAVRSSRLTAPLSGAGSSLGALITGVACPDVSQFEKSTEKWHDASSYASWPVPPSRAASTRAAGTAAARPPVGGSRSFSSGGSGRPNAAAGGTTPRLWSVASEPAGGSKAVSVTHRNSSSSGSSSSSGGGSGSSSGPASDAAARAALLRDNEQLLSLAEQAHAERQATRHALARIDATAARHASEVREQLALLAGQTQAAASAAATAGRDAADASADAAAAGALASAVSADQAALRSALLAACDALLLASTTAPPAAGATGGHAAAAAAAPSAAVEAIAQLRAAVSVGAARGEATEGLWPAPPPLPGLQFDQQRSARRRRCRGFPPVDGDGSSGSGGDSEFTDSYSCHSDSEGSGGVLPLTPVSAGAARSRPSDACINSAFTFPPLPGGGGAAAGSASSEGWAGLGTAAAKATLF